MTGVGPVAGQGIISTQLERVQSELPATQPPPVRETERVETPPPPPPAETGRGMTVDTSA